MGALKRLITLFNDATEVAEYNAFYLDTDHQAYTGTTSPKHILSAALRDFQDEEILNLDLYCVIMAVTYYRADPSSRGMKKQWDTDLQKKVVWAQIAACRRQRCRGSKAQEVHRVIFVRLADSMWWVQVPSSLLFPYL